MAFSTVFSTVFSVIRSLFTSRFGAGAPNQPGGGGSYTPALKYNDARNSQYLFFFTF